MAEQNESQEKPGSSFLTRSFLKNARATDKQNGSAILDNSTFVKSGATTIKALNHISDQLVKLNLYIKSSKFASAISSPKSLVRRTDPNEMIAKNTATLAILMGENNKLMKKKSNGIFDTLMGIGKTLAIGGLIGYLLFGDDKYIKGVRDMFGQVASWMGDSLKKWWDSDGGKMMNSFTSTISTWWDSDGKKWFANTSKNIFDSAIDVIMNAAKWSIQNPKEALIAGALGMLLTGNLGTILKLSAAIVGPVIGSIASSLVTAVIGAIGVTTLIPIVLGVLSAGAVVGAVLSFKNMLDAKADNKRNEDEVVKSSNEAFTNKHKAAGWSDEDIKSFNNFNRAYIWEGNESVGGKGSNSVEAQSYLHQMKKIQGNYSKDKSPEMSVEYKQNYAKSIFSSKTSQSSIPPLYSPDALSSDVNDYIEKAHAKYPNVPSDLIRAIITQESHGDPNAEGPMTRYGTAKGLGQFIDPTAAQYIPGWKSPQDSFKPEANVMGIAHYMDDLLSKSKGDTSKALMRYYGTGLAQLGMPTTQEYASQVMSKYQSVGQLAQTGNTNMPQSQMPKSSFGTNVDNTVKLVDNDMENLANKIGDVLVSVLKHKLPSSTQTTTYGLDVRG